MNTILIAAASVIPSLVLMWLFYRSDLFPEPPSILWKTFALGLLAILPAAAVEGLLGSVTAGLTNPAGALFDAFIVAALVEETLKLLVLRGYSFRKVHFNEPMDGIQYGVASALGFATLENILYVADGGLGVAVMRGLLSVPGHASWGALLGFYAGRGVLEGRPLRGSLAGLGAAVLFHGLYDFPIMLAFQGDKAFSGTGTQVLMFLLILAVSAAGWVTVLRLVARTRRMQADGGEGSHATTRTLYRGSMPPSRILHAVLAVTGLLLAIGGGLMTVSIAIAFATTPVDDPASTLIGGIIVGLLPLAAGILLYGTAARKLRRRGAARA